MYKLFKKDSRGRIRFLEIKTEGDEIIQTSGLVGGNPVINVSKCEAKNIGKSNETTSAEQAEIEAEAKFLKKLKEGYFKTKEEAQGKEVVLPMLAKSFDKEEKKVTYPCYAQPKLDGMRALGSCENGTLTSRSGNRILTLGEIVNNFPDVPSLILDGELYAHGYSFQENMRMIKKRRESTSNVKYHVYDVVSDKPFSERIKQLESILSYNDKIVLVPTIIVKNKEELIKFHAYNISQGYEGTIVRHGNDGYKLNGRSSSLLKLKDFQDLALPLLDVVPSEKKPTHGKPIFFWDGAENNRLGAGLSLSHEEAEDLLKNKSHYIGRMCELRFFEYSDKGVPRHPVMHGFRLDK